MPDARKTPVYVILGATGGIGSNISRRLAARDAHIVAGARSEDDLETLTGEIDADAFPLDATDFEQVTSIIKHAVDEHGRIDGVVNCVGPILRKPAHLTSVEEFDDLIRQNLHTAFYSLKAGAKAMMAADGGAIVLFSSAVARTGMPNYESLAAAKGGVISLTRSAAATYARHGIRVNCVAPGLVETPMTEPFTQNESAREKSEAMHPLGRIGQPADVGAAIDWLLDPESGSWVTGQVIGVDGGLGTLHTQ